MYRRVCLIGTKTNRWKNEDILEGVNEQGCDMRMYSHRHSNTLRQRGTRMYTTFSGILIDIRNTLRQRETRMYTTFSSILIDLRISFDKEKRGCVWDSQVFSSTFEYPSTKRNEDVYDILRYSHRHSNILRQRETRMCMAFSGILIKHSKYLR
jgi:hypothetical protein